MKLSTLFVWVPKRHYSIARETWEAQYSAGQWDYLRCPAELAHYSVIVGYCRHFKPQAAILDVGCGEGVLQDWLRPFYSQYVGVDLSAMAIERAAKKGDTNTAFLQGDGRTFVPGKRFDIVIFNESLYYFEQPLEVIRHYEGSLAPDGIFIVSNVVSRGTSNVRAQLADASRISPHTLLDHTWVRNSAGTRWELQVIRP